MANTANDTSSSNPPSALHQSLNIPVLQYSGAAPNDAAHPFGSRLPFPPEINARIFEYVIGNRPDTVNPHLLPGHLWRVNKAWKSYLNVYTASHYSFDGDANNIEGLWDFVEKVVTQPNQGSELRQLTFTTVNLFKKFDPQDARHVLLTTFRNGDRWLRQPKGAAQAHNQPTLTDNDNTIFTWLAQEYLDGNGQIKQAHRARISQWYHRALYIKSKPWLLQAFRDIGFDQGALAGQSDLLTQASKVLQAGKHLDGYHLPLIALALAYCPNLARLTIHIWPEETDPWLRRIFDYAVGRQGFATFNTLGTPPFRRLKTVNTAPKLCRRGGTAQPVANEDEPVSINSVQLPFHRLPGLQEAVLYHVKADATFGAIYNLPENYTQIEKLVVSGPRYGQLEIPTWVALSPRLRQLSFRIPGDEWPFFPPGGHLADPPTQFLEDTGPLLWAGLYPMLYHIRNQLEYLDLYQDLVHTTKFQQWENMSFFMHKFCFTFKEFPVLRHLTISPLICGGFECRHLPPERLRAHLPPNVETLGLYGANIHYIHGLPANPVAIEEEIRNIMADARQLRCLILESRLDWHRPANAFKSKYRDAYADAAIRGIQLRRDGENTMFYGGKGTWIGRSVLEGADQWKPRRYDMHSRHQEVIPQGLVVNGIEGNLQDTRLDPWGNLIAQTAANGDDDLMDVDQ
ncbi:hypothetical protein BJY00DRAFT_271698 [Aspergillus carlsbadensis]|nr:hypothetical protein BJY00DRAFT_271698 [Aspergillus carlsbadensis]